MYAVKNKIAAACGFEAPCKVALIYQCDVYNKHDVSMQDAYYFAAWPYFEATQ